MKLLIYGAGVIGCLYAALFSKAGYNTTIYARGKRLESLEKEGLLYWNGDEIHSANVTIINKLHKNDTYDYIFLTVRENQLHQALVELKDNNSPNIVTMVNSLEKYAIWEELCGKGRIIPLANLIPSTTRPIPAIIILVFAPGRKENSNGKK